MLKIRVAALALAVLLSGCSWFGSPQASSSPTPKPKVSSAPSAAGVSEVDWSVAWQGWGLRTPPPRNLAEFDREPFPSKAQNLTGGRVSDADIAKWLAGTQRSANIENYLLDHLDAEALTGGAIADPSKAAEVYGGDLKTIAAAKLAGAVGIALSVHFTDQAVGFVYVPDALRTDTSGLLQQFPLTEYVFVLRQRGPGRTDQVFADGHKVPVIQQPAGSQATYLVGGQYKEDPVLGPLWYGANQIDCKDFPKLQAICASLAP